VIEILKFIVVMPILAYAAYTDIKTRRADNRLWYLIGCFGIVINLFAFNYLMLITISVFTMIALSSYYLLHMGGADAKAIIAMSLMYPLSFFGLWELLFLSCVLGSVGAIFRSSWSKSIPFLFPMAISYLIIVLLQLFS
jgi:Flp pilus assembly protein protease CpaA